MFVQQLHDVRPQATAHLAQTMSLLALPMTDLEATLRKELNENPALELVEELRCPQCGRRLRRRPCPACAAPVDDHAPVVCVSPREPGMRAAGGHDDFEPLDLRTPERLDEYILRQVGPALALHERPIAAYILARLDDNGLLPEAPAEIAAYTRGRLADVERVLGLIQRADPPGAGARSPQASLLIQLECLADTLPADQLALARAIVQDHLELLAKRDYGLLGRRLGVSRAAAEAAAQFIARNLTPYPARTFWGDGKLPRNHDGAALHNPDVTISQFNRLPDGPLMVEVFAPLSGWLRVNPEIKALLSQCKPAEREKWSAVVERAALIAKCVQQRNHTMRRLMEILAQEQRNFILGGDGDLKPMTRARIASDLGLHESTISRAVAGKCVALPGGRIVPLSKFFDRSLSVRDRVRAIVEAEDTPRTDDQIAAVLAEEGIKIARRTVAKYRNMLGILPANMRARLAKAQPH